MYTVTNYRTKKALKDAVKAGEVVRLWSPGPFPPPVTGTTTVEGPHYPEPHRWYASVDVRDGIVKNVR